MPETNIPMYFAWLAPTTVLLGVAVLMVRRGLRASYPHFFAYVVYQVAITPLLFYFYHQPGDEYFYVYWAAGGVGTLLGLVVLYELFRHAFQPFPALRDLSSTLLRWSALLGIVFLFIFAIGMVGSATDRVLTTVLVLQRSVRVMQIALVLLMLLCASRLGLTWRNHVMGIATGFGIFAAVELMLFTVVARAGPSWYDAISLFKSCVYLGSVMIWFGVLYRPEPERVPEIAPQPVSTEAFSFALPESSLPPPPDSLLMSMEKMVERRLNGHGNGNGHGIGKANGNGHGQGQIH